MQRRERLEDVAWGASANRLIRLDNLPPDMRIREISLFFDLSGTKDAADALDGQLFARAVSNIKLAEYYNIPGWELQQLMHAEAGAIHGDPTDIPGSGATFDMEFGLKLMFRDGRQPASDDGSLETNHVLGKAIEITFSAANVWGVGNLLVTAGNVRADAELVAETNAAPQVTQVGYYDPGALTFTVEPGVYHDLLVCDGSTPGTVTRAEVATVAFSADGNTVLNNLLHEQLIEGYNRSQRDAAANLAHNAAPRLPLVYMDGYGKANLTKQVVVEKSGKGQLTGTITSPRIVYRRSLLKDAGIVQAAKARVGVEETTQTIPNTASKTTMGAVKQSKAQGAWTKKARVSYAALSHKAPKAA